ncbi:bifunctional folylpolyglutamate synthase/dihydrofolate synthase [Paracoccaceae bacterium]|nr:bifunctional folylpolyglutamate synthase/dihydrofolate synthase [Paracoccaceae bacterium]
MDEILKRLESLHPKIIDLKLDRVKRLLRKLGNPEKSIPPIIHVAGTNGKGSTIAMIKAGLQSSGLRTHAYTSPHLVHFNERIEITNKRISEDTLKDVLTECENVNNSEPITLFEITTCAAFLAFSRETADYTLLEVGLGGEFDATNVVQNPVVSIITPISFDHKEYLGNTIKKIALAKAGIIKKNIPTVISNQSAGVKKLLEARCRTNRSEIIWSAENFTVSSAKKSIIQKKGNKSIEFPFPSLNGTHQISNAMTAISTLNHLKIPENHICEGLKSTYWPARLQKIEKGNLFEFIKTYNINNQLWLDGGHNEAASIRLRESLSFINKKNLHIIYGSLRNKDHISFLKNLAHISSSLCLVEIENQSSSLLKKVAFADAKEVGWEQVYAAVDIRDAVKYICDKNMGVDQHVSILICGSLHLAGQALKENGVSI